MYYDATSISLFLLLPLSFGLKFVAYLPKIFRIAILKNTLCSHSTFIAPNISCLDKTWIVFAYILCRKAWRSISILRIIQTMLYSQIALYFLLIIHMYIVIIRVKNIIVTWNKLWKIYCMYGFGQNSYFSLFLHFL